MGAEAADDPEGAALATERAAQIRAAGKRTGRIRRGGDVTGGDISDDRGQGRGQNPNGKARDLARGLSLFGAFLSPMGAAAALAAAALNKNLNLGIPVSRYGLMSLLEDMDALDASEDAALGAPGGGMSMASVGVGAQSPDQEMAGAFSGAWNGTDGWSGPSTEADGKGRG